MFTKQRMLIIKVLLASFLVPITAFAASSASDQIEGAMGAKITARFASLAPGYTAILAEKGGKTRIFYEKDGLLFYGMMYNKEGQNITTIDVANGTKAGLPAQVAFNQPTTQPAEIIQPLEVGKVTIKQADINLFKWFKSKQAINTSNPIYILVDPNCPYCKALHASIKSNPDYSKKDIRWVPVGALTTGLSGDSQLKATALLASKDAFNAFDSIKPTKSLVSEQEFDVLNNNLLGLVKSDSKQIPTIIYTDSKSKSIVIKKGAPTDAELKKLLASH